jgi:hypothetical protein
LIDFLLTSICLSHGDNPRGIVPAWRVGNDDYPTVDQTQRDEPFLSIVETAICEGDARTGEHLFGVLKIQPVFSEVNERGLAGTVGL